MTHDDAPAEPPARASRRRNADYRWTVPKVTAFLEALARSGQVGAAARSVGMGRQSAYKLRARLAGTRLAAAFDGALRKGIRARAEASAARLRSQWDGPLIAAHMRALQGDTPRVQGDSGLGQGDTRVRQGDTIGPQGDRFAHKATKLRLDTVTSVTSPTPARRSPAGPRRVAHGLPATPAGVVPSSHAKGDS
jgi:hypothetical protein